MAFAVGQAFKELRAQRIFNVPYRMDFNGNEAFFSLDMAKNKKLVLQRLLKILKKVESVELVEKIHRSMEDGQGSGAQPRAVL
jgi:hypothetical protein